MWTDPEPMKTVDNSQREMSFRNIVVGVWRMVLWPFVLALAFALRITKVTIEVYEWSV